MIITRIVTWLAVGSAVAFLTACQLNRGKHAGSQGGGVSSLNIMQQVVKNCAAGEEVGPLLYLSTSNDIGPGSIWRRSITGSYQPSELLPTGTPSADAVVKRGQLAGCTGGGVSTDAVSADVGVPKLGKLLGGAAAVSWSRALKVTVSVDSGAWDNVLVGRFREMITPMDLNTGYRKSLILDSLVMGRGYRVKGLTADLQFRKNVADSIRLTLPQDLGGGGGARWVGGDSATLRVVIVGPVYLAAEMWRWQQMNFQAGTPPTVSIEPAAVDVPNPALRKGRSP